MGNRDERDSGPQEGLFELVEDIEVWDYLLGYCMFLQLAVVFEFNHIGSGWVKRQAAGY